MSISKFGVDPDLESTTNPAGSTIAHALDVRSRNPVQIVPSSGGRPSTSKDSRLKPSGRALINEFFSTTTDAHCFPEGHPTPTVAFAKDQISTVLKVIAEQAVEWSCDKMEKLIAKANEMSIGPTTSQDPTSQRSGKKFTHRADSLSGRLSDTSGAIRSDDDFSSIGYSYENFDTDKIDASSRAMDEASCSQQDHPANMEIYDADSPIGQTIASLKTEVLNDLSKHNRKICGRFASTSRGSGTRRKVTRSCKIMKEAYFKRMEWTRTFVSGPVDPRWNPYNFFCRKCKSNIFSIYEKGPEKSCDTIRKRSIF